ncbi:MAG: cyanophycin synthetase [Candidatus Marinamargulisbacteria bacterium]|jgi:cyanophycin synthetase
MIEIRELRALRGPNRYSRHTCIFMVLDIKTYESRPSDKIKGFSDRLVTLIPTLQDHRCSVGKPGGFIKRLKRGTWAGHIVEHIAIELQCLAGMAVGFGKSFETSEEGVYIVVFRYLVESAGLQAAKDAVKIFESVSNQKTTDIKKVVLQLKILRENDMLGPSTWSIVKEAISREIPFLRLNTNSYIQLGYGGYQKRIQATMSSHTSAIAVDIADGKNRTKDHLAKAGIPVPMGFYVSSEEEAIAAFNRIGAAVVVKPDVGNHGNGATINVTDLEQLKAAFHLAHLRCSDVVIEEFISGFDLRLLVINQKLVAAAKREPAHVIGDGKSSIKQLIDKVNADPRRGFGHEKVLTRIEIDNMTDSLLSLNGLSLKSRPKKGDIVYLKATANLSQGGTATDVTAEISPDIRLMAERAASIIGLDCAGVDALVTDLSVSLDQSGLKVVEVNAAPGFRMHLEPTNGDSQLVSKPFVDMLFPTGYIQVPLLAVTGTNGKTTTCKLIAHSLKYSGKNVGLACTTGIEIDGNKILDGDYSGPEGANIVMREPTVDHIVLEVARGGIVRRGLSVNSLDVGVLLNIGTDHLGSDWIETQEALSLIKSTVIEVVKTTGTSVLNADDELVMNVLDRARGNIILFSLDCNHPKLIEHVKDGNTVVTVNNQNVILRTKELDSAICRLDEIPITYSGVVTFNVSNALAAIGALHGLDLPIDQIRNGVMTFYPSVNQNPGRMNLFDFQTFKVLFDYGHNRESAQAMHALLPKISQGRKIALCHGTGSRTDKQLLEYGYELASIYDTVLLTDFDPRNRQAGETSQLLFDGLIKAGFEKDNIEIVPSPDKALDTLFSKAQPGDLLIVHPAGLEPMMSQIIERYRQLIK